MENFEQLLVIISKICPFSFTLVFDW